jgi:hypothetical protein
MSKPVTTTTGAVAVLLNSKAVRFTAGELNAVNRYAWMNGTDPADPQYDPGHVRWTTLASLVEKGVLVRKDATAVPHFAPGILPVVRPTIHAAEAFDLLAALTTARKEAEQPEPAMRNARALGENQRYVLEDLERRGVWYPGCTWYFNTTSGTTRVMKALEKRGLVSSQVADWDANGRIREYRITAAGRVALKN